MLLKEIKKMFKRFLEGFITVFPFICIDEKLISYFPDEIYRNDWKNVGNIFKLILRNNKEENNE